METNRRLRLMNLLKDFFLIKFHMIENYNKALHEGPWFIGQQFMAIRPWEPRFKASEVTFNSTTIWARFLELPPEFYDLEIVRKAGNILGTLLGIDICHFAASRGYYAQLYIQAHLNQPLITTLYFSSYAQPVIYEGVNHICFPSDRIGH
ncbi:hypothetical protein M9H77_12485 [Catharanthus roseus]|uniref:Uncharacterized protein n=1 Tax=Catharanthus roseus TaxID=4058 RepID=A0ACC0BHI0_CATRO|nr:hypothetical protein M9H77_12485 [Catharanthus roseus]